MAIKKKIIITGDKVQDVGYRVFLLSSALTFGMDKFNATNTVIKKKQAVIVQIGAEKEIIDDFYEYINQNVPEDASVSKIEIEDFEGHIMDIDRYMHLTQVEQLYKGIPAINDIKENTGKMLEKQDMMLEKQDMMLGKQDTAIEILKNVSEELKSVHEDTSDMKSTLSRIEIDVKDTKFSLSAFIEERYRKMEGEIAEIRATLAKMQEA